MTRRGARAFAFGVVSVCALVSVPVRASSPHIDVNANVEAVFLMELAGTPVGTVTLRLERDGTVYRYQSDHAFTRGVHEGRVSRSARFDLTAQREGGSEGEVLESLRLWRGPHAPGCVKVVSELEKRRGELCVTRRQGPKVKGTLHNLDFDALLGEDGTLARLELAGGTRFSRVAREVAGAVRAPADLFARGFELFPLGHGDGDGELALEPPLPALPPSARADALTTWPGLGASDARRLAKEVHASFPRKDPSAADFAHDADQQSASCLGHARRFVERAKLKGQDAALVQGLYAERGDDRAFPHAWVRVKTAEGVLELDPTLLQPVTPATHLALPGDGTGGEGTLWLELLSGRRRVVRAEGAGR